MAFPEDPLGVVVEAFIDDTWTDITGYTFTRDPIGITRGRSNEASQVQVSRCTLTVNNRDGRFSPRNPASPYYGQIGRNTPIRVKVGDDIRFSGEVPAWPQRWDKTGNDVWVSIEAAGILRRLGQGATPLRSALFRELTSEDRPVQPVAYWPCEDDRGATSIASGVGGTPMVIDGAPNLASFDGIPSSDSLPQMKDGRFSGKVPTYTVTGETIVVFTAFIPNETAPNPTFPVPILRLDTTGGLKWEVWFQEFSGNDPEATRLFVTARDDEGSFVSVNPTGFVGADVGGVADHPLGVAFRMEQNGANVDCALLVRKLLPSGEVLAAERTGAASSVTVGRITRIVAAPERNLSAPEEGVGDSALGHIAFGNDFGLFTDFLVDAMNGFHGEAAGRRVERLCHEEGVPFTSTGDLDDTAAMGPQGIATFLDLVHGCADTDLGILYEPRDSLSLAYRTRTDLYNQDPALELDYIDGVFAATPEPVDDDQNTRNDVTVKRPGGSSARAILETGPLSVQPPPDGVGRYDTSVDANVAEDRHLADQATWRLHLGTVDEPRFPRLALPLHVETFAGDASLTDDAAALDLGDLVEIDNMPTWVSHDLVTQMVQGLTETLDTHLWTISANTSPGSPFRVLVLDDDLGRLDTAGTVRPASSGEINTTTTFLTFETIAGPVWTEDAGDFPFDIMIGGERMTVTSIAEAGSGHPFQVFTVVRSVNGVVKSHPVGVKVDLFQPARLAL